MSSFEFDMLLFVPTTLAVAFLLWALWNFSKTSRK
jgi:hypothetical protein